MKKKMHDSEVTAKTAAFRRLTFDFRTREFSFRDNILPERQMFKHRTFYRTIGDLVLKETVCYVGGKVKH